MDMIWFIVIGLIAASGIYLIMERHIIKIVFGLMLLSNSVNLSLFFSGRITSGAPALISYGETVPPDIYANPLPQALVLTAIVIGFGLLIFTLSLCLRFYQTHETLDSDSGNLSEQDEGAK